MSERAPLSAKVRDAFEVVNTPFRFVQDALRFPRSERRYTKRVSQSLAQRPEVVMVYSATKTASTAVAAALEACGAFTVIKVHYLQPEHFWPGSGTPMITPAGVLRHRAIEQRTTRKFLADYQGPVRVVSLVRDPIAFNISNFTYFGRAYWLRTHWRSARWMPQAELAARFFSSFPHESSSRWWQQEFAPSIGFDPLAKSFSVNDGWSTRNSGRFQTLIMRTDLPDAQKSEALRAWLPGVTLPEVSRTNENENQAPPELATRLRAAVRNAPEYVDRLMELPAAKHFWSSADRAAMRSKWLT